MATSRARLAAVAAAALGIGAAGLAQDRPESLLPPGFGDPAPSPTPTGASPAPVGPGVFVQPLPGVTPTPSPSVSPSPSPSPTSTVSPYQLPAFARRSLAQVGVAQPGVPADAFGSADGRYLESLMRRLSVPLPSRWLSIALRRLLVAQVDTPTGVNGSDFAAERAWLLLRMGESVSARAVAQGVDTENVTPKLRQVWMQTSLATADPGGLCPLADTAGNAERGWIVARAMCAALGGTGKGPALIADVRRRRVASGIDLQLAQKVSGAALNSRQAITIDWGPVTDLTAWRFGLATATGVAVPDELYATVGPQVAGWRALAPAIPLAERVAPAERAAAMGVLSNVALVDLYSAVADDEAAPGAVRGDAATVRDAYVGGDRAARLSAMRKLWDGAATPAARHARLILTARAAARVVPAAETPDSDRLIASMLTAGLGQSAERWRGVVPAGGDGWAMLALADADGRRVDPADYAPTGAAAARKKQMFFAGLAGLGRLSPAQVEESAAALDVKIGAATPWTRAIDRAVREGQSGTVLLLAAVGMQTRDWTGVPPEHLYRIVAALRAVGMEGKARMIAAEAIARL